VGVLGEAVFFYVEYMYFFQIYFQSGVFFCSLVALVWGVRLKYLFYNAKWHLNSFFSIMENINRFMFMPFVEGAAL
jgi:hypothetical protein